MPVTQQGWFVELEGNVWLADWKGSPGRTTDRAKAKAFINEHAAKCARGRARKFKPFPNAKVYQNPAMNISKGIKITVPKLGTTLAQPGAPTKAPAAPPKETMQPWNTQQVEKALEARFDTDEFALFWQVANATGYQACRWCDALVMSLWPSRGLHLTGFEIKISRSDWIKELKTPKKAETLAQYCDFWYIVAGSDSIVQDGELPVNWGLMVPRKDGKLYIVKQAAQLKPRPLTKEIIASIFRRGQDRFNRKKEWLVNNARTKAFDDGRASVTGSLRTENEHLRRDLNALRMVVQTFEYASGLSIAHAEPHHIGSAVRMVMNKSMVTPLENAKAILTSTANAMEDAIRDMQRVQGMVDDQKQIAERVTPV